MVSSDINCAAHARHDAAGQANAGSRVLRQPPAVWNLPPARCPRAPMADCAGLPGETARRIAEGDDANDPGALPVQAGDPRLE